MAAAVLVGCTDDGDDVSGGAAVEPERLVVEVVETHPHDSAAFTQGLQIVDGTLVESTGRYGESTLRTVDVATGEVIERVDLDPELFGEGVAAVSDRLVQITWQEGVAIVYDTETLAELDRFRYDGEGWGLCHDGERLVMSDGSATLTFRDPDTFEETGTVEVRRDGVPVERLNELECVDGEVWANVLPTSDIVRIDPSDGTVTAVVDAGTLLQPRPPDGNAVLNGIAHDPESDTFLVTGKLWPSLFRVRFVPERGSGGEGS